MPLRESCRDPPKNSLHAASHFLTQNSGRKIRTVRLFARNRPSLVVDPPFYLARSCLNSNGLRRPMILKPGFLLPERVWLTVTMKSPCDRPGVEAPVLRNFARRKVLFPLLTWSSNKVSAPTSSTSLLRLSPSKPASKQTSEQTNQRAHRPAGRQASKQAGKHASKHGRECQGRAGHGTAGQGMAEQDTTNKARQGKAAVRRGVRSTTLQPHFGTSIPKLARLSLRQQNVSSAGPTRSLLAGVEAPASLQAWGEAQ